MEELQRIVSKLLRALDAIEDDYGMQDLFDTIGYSTCKPLEEALVQLYDHLRIPTPDWMAKEEEYEIRVSMTVKASPSKMEDAKALAVEWIENDIVGAQYDDFEGVTVVVDSVYE